MLHQVSLLTFDSTVSAPEGIIYSTSPHTAEGVDGITYFVKGPEPEVVFAEIVGCLLAREVGLPVADVAVCTFNDRVYCGSRKVADSFRNAAPWLSQPHKVRNFTDLYNVIVVYAWLANDDRNLGNVLARPIRGSEIEVVMIDFEKSKALRPNPLMGSANVEARKLWPTGELGQELRRQKPLFPGHPVVERIENLGSNRCSEIIAAVVEKVGPIPWSGNSIEALSRRATRIAQIAGEIWKQN